MLKTFMFHSWVPVRLYKWLTSLNIKAHGYTCLHGLCTGRNSVVRIQSVHSWIALEVGCYWSQKSSGGGKWSRWLLWRHQEIKNKGRDMHLGANVAKWNTRVSCYWILNPLQRLMHTDWLHQWLQIVLVKSITQIFIAGSGNPIHLFDPLTTILFTSHSSRGSTKGVEACVRASIVFCSTSFCFVVSYWFAVSCS